MSGTITPVWVAQVGAVYPGIFWIMAVTISLGVAAVVEISINTFFTNSTKLSANPLITFPLISVLAVANQ
jgi:hypothetical protein